MVRRNVTTCIELMIDRKLYRNEKRRISIRNSLTWPVGRFVGCFVGLPVVGCWVGAFEGLDVGGLITVTVRYPISDLFPLLSVAVTVRTVSPSGKAEPLEWLEWLTVTIGFASQSSTAEASNVTMAESDPVPAAVTRIVCGSPSPLIFGTGALLSKNVPSITAG